MAVRLAMLLHDCGKPGCFTLDGEGTGHFYGHAQKSLELAGTVLRRLRVPRLLGERVLLLIHLHDRPVFPEERWVKRQLGRWGEEYAHIADCFDEKLERLLDIGCGTGLELASLYRRFPSLQVTGIDLSETMLGQLRASYPDRDLRLIQADYTAWDLGEREYDGVLSFETLHHLLPEEKEKLYVKMFRALRPGGCYMECDYMACCQEEQDLCWNHYQYRRAKYGVRPGRLVHIDIPLTLDRQVELLDRAGFVNIQVLHQRECTVILKAYRPGSACFI